MWKVKRGEQVETRGKRGLEERTKRKETLLRSLRFFLGALCLCREVRDGLSSLTCCNKDDTILSNKDGVSATLFRRGCQTALCCKSRKAAVVNVQGKGGLKSIR